jgi:hypothetical protein
MSYEILVIQQLFKTNSPFYRFPSAFHRVLICDQKILGEKSGVFKADTGTGISLAREEKIRLIIAPDRMPQGR